MVLDNLTETKSNRDGWFGGQLLNLELVQGELEPIKQIAKQIYLEHRKFLSEQNTFNRPWSLVDITEVKLFKNTGA